MTRGRFRVIDRRSRVDSVSRFGAGGTVLLNLLPGGPTAEQIAGSGLAPVVGPAITTARSTTKFVRTSASVLASIAANVTPVDYRGLYVEGPITNLLLHSRDQTQAAWVKSNCTAARTATGPDGSVNTATTLTATAGNGTCLQSITATATARMFCPWVRRRTGTGTVEITKDNGSTWTAIALTSAWAQFGVSGSTLNPTIGFRIVTSGDAIDVDFVDYHSGLGGTVATSPIVTAGASASRSGDVVSLTNPLTTGNTSWYFQCVVVPGPISGASQGMGLLHVGASYAGANTAAVYLNTNGTLRIESYDSGATLKRFATTAAVVSGDTVRVNSYGGVLSASINGANAAGATSGAGTGIISTMPGTLYLGAQGNAASSPTNGSMHSILLGTP